MKQELGEKYQQVKEHVREHRDSPYRSGSYRCGHLPWERCWS